MYTHTPSQTLICHVAQPIGENNKYAKQNICVFFWPITELKGNVMILVKNTSEVC